MKKIYSDCVSLSVVGLSLIAGALLASSVGFQRVETQQPLDLRSYSGVEAHELGATPGKYVQEPARRSSFRPPLGSSIASANERSSLFMLRAFQEVVAPVSHSTVRLFANGQQVALGAVVDSEGWIATKSTQLPMDIAVTCRTYDGNEFVGEVVNRVSGIDIALVKIDAINLPSIQWNRDLPARGKWLATADLSSLPIAVGVASAGVQRVRASAAVLGVYLDEAPSGASIRQVLPGSGAAEAGLKANDVIFAVEGEQIRSQREFRTAVSGGYAGQPIRLSVSRQDREFDVTARLMDLSDELLDETEMEVSGQISPRATGFARVLVHDTVLQPNQCGGPLVNLDGQVVGINIARAGRVSSYALPSDVVQPVVEGLIEQARLVSLSNKPQTSLRPVR
ncbi:PDZ domain-containing protein [Aureliella helgolandensis]|uniref:Periplasmic pH-dependent serine endoprotease DegQ n=1 Tax=Aureliella helgolandensis TaxID=2527968 RepID=A0A518GAM7_9BACT|nr:PDZ domain-containing protein [Aureliella helgolandensis]QDV25619.1 Periplasmic pH-dependent serine endoprotease DegQ precursor [Aureliella helgolandensis]